MTEVLIALALVALLLVGISRIFALTSETIGVGQAFSTTMRGHRAVGQLLSQDFLGVGTDIASPSLGSGVMPLVNSLDKNNATPFLAISNFRVATYRNAGAMASDSIAPPDATTISDVQFRARSLAIRGTDTNNDGVENPGSVVTNGGETVPLFAYGDRNFRTDTISFFTRGAFHSQTGSNGRYVDDISSNEAWVWYGQLRTFNSIAAQLNTTTGHGMPGDWLTPAKSGANPFPASPNSNNRFADQFRLGRYQFLLVEPIDHDGNPGTLSPAGNLQDFNTIVAGGDPSQYVYFGKRNWWDPNYKETSGSPPSRPTLTPINLDSSIQVYDVGTAKNRLVRVDDTTTSTADQSSMRMCRTDIAGVGLQSLCARARFVQQNDIDVPPTSAQSEWWEFVPHTWADRYYVNPFPALNGGSSGAISYSSQAMSQRQQLVAESTSQFIVEFAGDFVTQNATSGTVTSSLSDGILDFAVVNGVKQTRWYGLPRDVDADGVIAGTGSARFSSVDVIPVRDIAGTTYSFEKSYPATVANYALVTAEPTVRANASTANGSPDDTAYICIWGPLDLAASRSIPSPFNPAQQIIARPVPQLIRIVVDQNDPEGKLKQPVTQEYVFPLRIDSVG